MSLLAWYPLNGDTKDYSGNGNHILNTDTATCTINTEGKIGQCYKFNGTKDGELETPISSSQLKDFTICFWLFNVETNSKSLFGSNINYDSRGINFYLYPNNTDFHWSTRQSGYDWSTYVQNVIPTNEWTHIALINKERSKETILFINGRKVFTKKWSSSFVKNNDHIFIGGADDIASSSKFNDVRIYDEALTAMQIKEIAQAKICHYTCNEQMYENTKNLFNNRNQLSNAGVVDIKWNNDHDITFSVPANTSWAGLKFNFNIPLKTEKKYTISYKLQKVDGILRGIRGHMQNFNINSDSINERSNVSYQNGIIVNDNFDIYELKITFSPKEGIVNLNDFYIQPNAFTEQSEYVRVRVWDIQVEEKDHATPFTPDTRIATLKDISGFGYDMTSPLEYSPTWKNDEKKSYFELKNKANFYVNKPFSSFLFNFTLSCWIKTNDDEALCLLGTNTGNNSDFAIGINNGKACLHTYTITSPNEGDANYAKSNTSINDNSWHLVSITYDGTTIKTYINGKLENQQNAKFIFANSSSDCLSISMKNINDFGDYENRRYTGCIRDARVYATALSDEDVKLLYQPEIIIDKANAIRCNEINESFKTIKKHIEIKSKGFELKADAKVVIDNYTRIIDTVGWEVIEIKKDNTINVAPFSTHASNNKFIDLMNYIKQLDKHSIIILATKDQPSGNLNMNSNNSCISFVNYLNSIGSSMTKDFPFRGAYAGIIYNGQIIKEEINNVGTNSSAEIILDELLIDSAILDDSTFNGFNKNATLNFKEFSEIPEIQSGVHNLKLGNDILPVLIDMDNDGGRWARIFYHNNHSGTVLFSNDNDWAEAKETNINNPITSDKYSILSKLEYFRQNTNCYFEFKLKYPTLAPNEQNIWKQKSNPTFETVKNYKPINISWTSQGWGGLERSSLFGNTDTFIDGTVNDFNWHYAIGVKNSWKGGIPAWDAPVPVMDDVELWIRINDFDLFTDINQEIAINSKTLTAKEFKEIY